MKDLLQVIVFGGAFLILLLPTVVSDSMYFPFITGKNFYFRILVEIIFGAWAILALLDVQFRPRLSWILVSAGALLSVMLFANLNSEHVLKSFWSNFERMDGYVTLVHFFLYFVVLGSILNNRPFEFMGMFKTTTWKLFLSFAVVAAMISAFFALQEVAGLSQSAKGWRLNATLGNAAYMAVYMLFNTFIAIWLAVQTKSRVWQIILGAISLLFMFLLVQTATRGTIVGLAGGLFIGAGYIALFNTAYPAVRKAALGALVAVVLVVGGLFALKDTSFVQDNIILDRASSIGFSELTLRTQIWEMALQGVEERPILGWGQGNFNYIFNSEYIPEIYYAELWYDRAHNVFLDWLVAGGILGLVAYLSIFAACTYYLLIRPLLRSDDAFTVTERGVLLGIIGGYFAHNLVVFDNIVSVIFFAILLALIHSRVAEPVPKWQAFKFDSDVVAWVATPLMLVAVGLTIYFVNIPGMRAATDIIQAISSPDPAVRLAEFDEGLSRNSFGRQEVVEQLVQRAIAYASDPQVPNEVRGAFAERAEIELLALAADKPGDARIHVFISGFYRSFGMLEQAAEQADIARSLSPNKPSVVIDQGVIAFQLGDIETATAFFKEAYELEPANAEAQILYASILLFSGDSESVDRIVEEKAWKNFARSAFAINAAEANNETELLLRIMNTRIELDPQVSQHRASKSFIQHRDGDMTGAVETLEEAAEVIPEFAPTANCFIANIEAGKTPSEGC